MYLILFFIFNLFILLFLFRLYLILPNRRFNASSRLGSDRNRTFKTFVVLGSGGHTAEMIKLLGTLNFHQYTPRHYIVGSADTHSSLKAQALESSKSEEAAGDYSISVIPRSRHVGQSFFTSIFTTILSFLFTLMLTFTFQPELLLVNGPGTCVPVVWSVILMNALCFWRKHRCKIIFIESVCRVYSLSLSAKLLVPFLDRLIVQWPSLQSSKAEYFGRLI